MVSLPTVRGGACLPSYRLAAPLWGVADFIGCLKTKQESELDPETGAWMAADLSRMNEIAPCDWGSA